MGEKVPYEIVVAPKAKRDLAALPHNALSRIDSHILSLSSNPRPVGSKKLKGLENVFRIRSGTIESSMKSKITDWSYL